MDHEFKPKEWVLTRDDDDEDWKLNIFSHKGEDCFCCVSSVWCQCIPYEGNEHLLGTSDSPEEKEEFKFGDKVEWRGTDGKWNKGLFILDDGTACPYMIYDPEDNDTFYVDKEEIRHA